MKKDSQLRLQTPVSSYNSLCKRELFYYNVQESVILYIIPLVFYETNMK